MLVNVQQEKAHRHLGRCAAQEIPWNGEEVEFGSLHDLIRGQVEFMVSKAVGDGHSVENDSHKAERLRDIQSVFVEVKRRVANRAIDSIIK